MPCRDLRRSCSKLRSWPSCLEVWISSEVGASCTWPVFCLFPACAPSPLYDLRFAIVYIRWPRQCGWLSSRHYPVGPNAVKKILSVGRLRGSSWLYGSRGTWCSSCSSVSHQFREANILDFLFLDHPYRYLRQGTGDQHEALKKLYCRHLPLAPPRDLKFSTMQA